MMSLTKLTMVVVFPLPLTISGFSVSVSDGLSERTFFFLTVLIGYRRGISTRSVFFVLELRSLTFSVTGSSGFSLSSRDLVLLPKIAFGALALVATEAEVVGFDFGATDFAADLELSPGYLT